VSITSLPKNIGMHQICIISYVEIVSDDFDSVWTKSCVTLLIMMSKMIQ